MARLRLGVLISGRGSNLAALIEASRRPEFPAEIALVVSNVADAQGLCRAEAAGLARKVMRNADYPDRAAFEVAVAEALDAAAVELVCLAGFMRMLSETFLERWAGRVVNIHPSLLPAFKGLEVHERVLASGVRISGCTVHYVVPEMDAGPIIAQAAVPVAASDTESSLGARVLRAEHQIYPLAVRLIAEGRARCEAGVVRITGSDGIGDSLFNPVLG